jgi:hypothetical protein
VKNAAIFTGGVVTGVVGFVGSFIAFCVYMERKIPRDLIKEKEELLKNIRICTEEGWSDDLAYWQAELDKLSN